MNSERTMSTLIAFIAEMRAAVVIGSRSIKHANARHGAQFFERLVTVSLRRSRCPRRLCLVGCN